jgi:hypothetical protein
LGIAASAIVPAHGEEAIPFVVPISHVEAPGVEIPAAPAAPAASAAPVEAPSAEEVHFISPAAQAVVPGGSLINPLGGEPAAIPGVADVPSFVVPAARDPERVAALPVDLPVSLTNPAAVLPESGQWAGGSGQEEGSDKASIVDAPSSGYAAALDLPGVLDTADLAAAVNPAVLMQPAEEVAPPAGEPGERDRRLYRPITAVTVNAELPSGLSPGEPGSEIDEPPTPPTPQFGDARLVGGWPVTDFNWAATGMYHKPLYFEEVNLERYGYTMSPVLQPLISGAHFFATIPVLPYKMTTHPPHECYYTLGHYRPGSCAPRRWHHERALRQGSAFAA